MSAVQDFVNSTYIPAARDLVVVTRLDEQWFVVEGHDPVHEERILRLDLVWEGGAS